MTLNFLSLFFPLISKKHTHQLSTKISHSMKRRIKIFDDLRDRFETLSPVFLLHRAEANSSVQSW